MDVKRFLILGIVLVSVSKCHQVASSASNEKNNNNNIDKVYSSDLFNNNDVVVPNMESDIMALLNKPSLISPLMKQAEKTDQFILTNKRANGFLPMRGRKASSDENSAELELVDLLEKRRVNSFMPMRGRKSANDAEFYGTILPQTVARKLFYSNFPKRFSSFDQNELIMSPHLEPLVMVAQKRGKGVSFFGLRGKRSLQLV